MNTDNRSLIKRIMAIVLCAFISIAYTPGLAYALEEQPEDVPEIEENLDAGESDAGTEVAGEVSQEPAEAEAPAVEETPAEQLSYEPESALMSEESNESEADGGSKTISKIHRGTTKDLAESDELLGSFMERQIATSSKKRGAKSVTNNRKSTLTEEEQDAYETLQEELIAVVSGDGEQHYSEMSVEGELEWDSAQKVIYALMADMPYEFFWYDKTEGFIFWTAEVDGLVESVFLFSVVEAYRGDTAAWYEELTDEDDQPVNIPVYELINVDIPIQAAEYAKSIVDNDNSDSDADRLIAYKDAICDLASYNDEAADENYEGGYGDPWQMIHVFDQDDDTKVVCEGYSKAFQYLCDYAQNKGIFDSKSIECYSVTGLMSVINPDVIEGAEGAGNHMWNILHMDDGKNYIADITNSDTGTVGWERTEDEPDGSYLFLNGYVENEYVDGYCYDVNGDDEGDILYTYDKDTTGLYDQDELTMSMSAYGEGGGGEDEEIRLEECRIVFNTNYYNGEVPYYSVDSKYNNETLSLADLGISIRHGDEVIDPDKYTLKFTYLAYDEVNDREYQVDAELPFGVQPADMGQGYDYTEYYVKATAVDGSGLIGETDSDEGTFYVRDKHSLQFMGALVSFANGVKDSWRMRDRFWIRSGEMTAPSVAAIDAPGTPLTEGTDYTLKYYRTKYDPDNNDPDNDGEINSWDEYLDEDAAYELSAMPVDPGHYFMIIDGTGDYTGHGRVLFDIVNYSPISVDHDGDMLWSDGTKELSIPAGMTGNLKLSGTASRDDNNVNVYFELDNACYEYDAAIGKIVLDGNAIRQRVGNGAWLDLKVDLVDADETLIARGFASFEFKEALYEYDLQSDSDVLPGWGFSIDRHRFAREESARFPGGTEGDITVLSVKVIHGAELLNADIDSNGYMQRDGDDWHFDIIEWSENFNYDAGPAEFEITYEDLAGEEQTYTMTLNVKESVYRVNLSSDDNRYVGLPGHDFDMTAKAVRDYVDEDGYHRVTEGLTYKWFYSISGDHNWTELPSAGIDATSTIFANFNSTGNTAHLGFVAATDGRTEDVFYVRAAVTDGDGNVQAYEDVWFYYSDWYVRIEPLLLGDLEAGESTDYMSFEVREYSVDYDQQNGGYKVVKDPEFTWVFEDDDIGVKEQYSEAGQSHTDVDVESETPAHGNTFKVTRKSGRSIDLTLNAKYTNQNGDEKYVEERYWFDEKENDFYIERGNDMDVVYTDGTQTYTLEGNVFDDPDRVNKFKIEVEVGTGEWVDDNNFTWDKKFKEGREYSVSTDGRVITFNGSELKEYADDEFYIFARIILKDTDIVIAETDDNCWVREPWIDYGYGDHETLPGWGVRINSHNEMGIENAEHPDRYDIGYEVTAVEVTSGADFLKEDCITTDGGVTVLKKFIDGDDVWYEYNIKTARELDLADLGDVELTVYYKLDAQPGETAETGSFTFKVSVVTDIYDGRISLESVDGRETGLPGDVIDLKAGVVTHHYIDENGESREEEITPTYDWYCDWGDQNLFTIDVDENDSSIAHVTLKAPQNGDPEGYMRNFCIGLHAFVDIDGKPVQVSENSFNLTVASEYVELLPLKIDDLSIGESKTIELQAVKYSIDGNPEDVTASVQFRLFSEGGFTITDSDGDVEDGELIHGTEITITRSAHWNNALRIRVEEPGSTIDKGDTYTTRDYGFSYVETDLQDYDIKFKNSEDGWRLFGNFTDGSTVNAADEIKIMFGNVVLDPQYYDLKIFYSDNDEGTGQQVNDGVFTYHGNDKSSYYVKAVVNEAGKAVGLSGETSDEVWIDLCSTTSLDPFGPDVYFDGHDTSAGPHPQRDYYWFSKGTAAAPTVKLNGKALVAGTDYDVSYVDEYTKQEYSALPATPGTYTCLIKPHAGSGYTGENGLVCVVVLGEGDVIYDLGYSEFKYDEANDKPTWKNYYDASFDQTYRKLEDIATTPYEDWFYVVPEGTVLDPTLKLGNTVIAASNYKVSYLEQEFDPTALDGEGSWGPKDGAEWLDEFPTKEGVYFCRLEGKSPYYGRYESFDLIRVEGCVHTNMTEHAAVAATCTEGGNSAYWYCSDCGKYYLDKDATQVTTLEEVTLPALGHDFGEPTYEWAEDNSTVKATRTCERDGCGETETETVTVTSEVTKKPTCTEKGEITYTTEEFKNEDFSVQSKTEETNALGHQMSRVDAAAPTCETEGNNEHWKCARCKKLFNDEAGSEETTAEAVTISKLNHDWSTVTYEPTEEGFDPASGAETVTASRTCGNPSHNEAVDGPKTQTETKTMTKQTDAASCTAAGTVTYTVAFDNPAFGIWTTTRNVSSVGHSWSEVTYTWNDDYSKVTATRTCTNPNHNEEADGPKTQTETVSATGEVTTAPTCEAKGKTTYTSSAFENPDFVVQHKTVENVAALGHKFGEPTYEWAEDNSTVTATRTCERDGCGETESETVTVTSEVTKKPTCTEKGETTYTPAAFRNGAFETQAPKTLEDVSALGHDWSISRITKRATASTAGEITYTCALCGTENPEKGVIAPLGHDPINQEAEAAIADADSIVETGTEEEIESALTAAQTAADAAVENAGEALEAAKQALDDAVTEQDIAAAQAAVNAAKQDLADATATQKKAIAVTAKSKAKRAAASAAAMQSTAAAQATAGTDAAVNAAQAAVNAANTAQREAQAAVAAAQVALDAAEATGDADAITAANDALTEANTALGKANGAVIAANSTYGTAVNARNAAIIAAQTPVEYHDLPVVKISKPKAAKKKITVKWKALKKDKKFKKILKKVSGVQIEVATDPGFSNIVARTSANTKKASKVIKGLQPKTKYYVRVRAYGPGNHYSIDWKSKNAKVK